MLQLATPPQDFRPEINIESAAISEDSLKKVKKENDHCYLKSKFGFIMATNGFRPCRNHVLLGKTGDGKTTLIRDIAKDTSQYGRVIIWGTEEGKEEFHVGISKDPHGMNLDNISVYSEKDHKKIPQDPFAFIDLLEEKFRAINPYLVILDNITTSFIYNDLFKIQPLIVKRLARMAEYLQCPLLTVTHPEKGMGKHAAGLISSENVRGKAQLAIEAPTFYVLQRFQIGERYFSFITIEKHRGFQIEKHYYQLTYSSWRNSYTGDVAVDFKEIKDAYKLRNKL